MNTKVAVKTLAGTGLVKHQLFESIYTCFFKICKISEVRKSLFLWPFIKTLKRKPHQVVHVGFARRVDVLQELQQVEGVAIH